MQQQEPPIYRMSYELTISISRFLKDCHQDYKLTLGYLLQKEVLIMQDLIYKISYSQDQLLAMKKALSSCYFLRTILRLFLDLNIMRLETNLLFNTKLEDLIKQLESWKKSYQRKNNKEEDI